MHSFPKRWFLFSFFVMHAAMAAGQCISAFPFTEDFESGPGTWVSGGLNADWSYGIPSKSTINAAGSGSYCWITGGLSNATYNGGQKSWIQSPCFDFSALNYPYLSFLIFWDTERQYDGGNLQYSLNGGSTWINIGSSGGGSDCKTMNWFNSGGINSLSGLASPQHGWSGNGGPTIGSCLGGNGSGGWKRAGYCLTQLAGESNVLFRFTFGSGTTCNNFDGLAIDSFSVAELEIPNIDFTYTCESASRVRFTGSGGDCPSQVQWDFGDPASAFNTSSSVSDTHSFSGPGSYLVTFSINEPCIGFVSRSRRLLIPEINAIVYPETCNGTSDGSIKLDVSYLPAPVFNWNPVSPLNTDSLSGLAAGTYQVTVSGDSSCTQTLALEVNINPDGSPVPDLPDIILMCPGEEVLLDPGNFQSYLWTTGSNDPFIIVNDTGWYGVNVSNPSGCQAADSVLLIANCFTGVYVPGAFSPNADGKNDVFMSFSGLVNDFEMKVYNRLGELVFSSSDQLLGWDGTYEGTECPEGVYTWQISYSTQPSKIQILKGIVNLIR